MRETDYSHRDLCSSTAGVLEAFHNMSQEDTGVEYDQETVEAIIKAFNKEHEKHGAETPTPDIE